MISLVSSCVNGGLSNHGQHLLLWLILQGNQQKGTKFLRKGCSREDWIPWSSFPTLSILSSHSLLDCSSAMKAWCLSHLLWRFLASSYVMSWAVSIFSLIHRDSWRKKQRIRLSTNLPQVFCIVLIMNYLWFTSWQSCRNFCRSLLSFSLDSRSLAAARFFLCLQSKNEYG